MAGRRSCVLLKNKEAVTVILWYATCISVNFSVFTFFNSWIQNHTVTFTVTSTSIIILYSVLGLFAEIQIDPVQLMGQIAHGDTIYLNNCIGDGVSVPDLVAFSVLFNCMFHRNFGRVVFSCCGHTIRY